MRQRRLSRNLQRGRYEQLEIGRARVHFNATEMRYDWVMAVVARVRGKRIVWIGAYAILSFVLGVWGAYDYWVRIPEHEANYAAYGGIKSKFDELEKRSATIPLTPVEVAEYDAAKTALASFVGGAPEPVPAYDRPLQLWVYFVGCGLLGTPWCCMMILKLRRQHFEFDDAGNLSALGVRIAAENIASIDMSQWMNKSIATVHGVGGERIKIDDYMMENANLIIGSLANRFEPLLWNTDATKVKPPEEEEEARDKPLNDAPSEGESV